MTAPIALKSDQHKSSSVLAAVKDAARRRGGLRPSLTAPARAALAQSGRDEGMVSFRRTKGLPSQQTAILTRSPNPNIINHDP